MKEKLQVCEIQRLLYFFCPVEGRGSSLEVGFWLRPSLFFCLRECGLEFPSLVVFVGERYFSNGRVRVGLRFWQFASNVCDYCVPDVSVAANWGCMFSQVAFGRAYFVPDSEGLFRGVRTGQEGVVRVVQDGDGILGKVLR